MIQPKPFSFSERLKKTIFKPRPHFFNAEDLNKQFSIIQEYIDRININTVLKSNIKFNVSAFAEVITGDGIDRNIELNYQMCFIEVNGVRFTLPSGSVNYSTSYAVPATGSPKPPTYVVLTADLDLLTYADNTALCGLQSDEYPSSVPSVDVQQYNNPKIQLTDDVYSLDNVVAIIGVFHPRYDTGTGEELTFGFVYYTMNNPQFDVYNNGKTTTTLNNNGSLFEYLINKIQYRLGNVLNEIQLVKKFNLADLQSKTNARHNLGLSNLVNHRQLVREENLKDVPNKENARYHLGLGNSATKNVGAGVNDVASGAIMPIGAILIWSGSSGNVPPGWKLCDGSNGTPDLSGKFVVQISSDPEFNLVGKSGGAKNKTLTANHLPKHSHEVTDPGHTHRILGRDRVGNGNENALAVHDQNGNIVTSKEKTGITIPPSGGFDNPTPIDTLPPYYVLCYIMFVGIEYAPAPQDPEQPEVAYPNYSTPTNTTDGGYSTYTYPSNAEVNMGSGIVVMNPE